MQCVASYFLKHLRWKTCHVVVGRMPLGVKKGQIIGLHQAKKTPKKEIIDEIMKSNKSKNMDG